MKEKKEILKLKNNKKKISLSEPKSALSFPYQFPHLDNHEQNFKNVLSS